MSWRCWLIGLLLIGGLAIGAWAYGNRQPLRRQWAVYQVGAAKSYETAQERLAWFDEGPDPDARLGELVGKWGTGNRQFDLYLARYLGDPAASRRLRQAFSEHLSRWPVLLSRWAHYWAYRAPMGPDEQLASVVDYFDTLYTEAPDRRITWREVLDLQAVFYWVESSPRAVGLSPENWREHYRVWLETRPDELPSVARPETALPDLELRKSLDP